VDSHPLCKLQKRCTRLAAASDKVYQLLAHGRWFSPGTPASSTTKTGCDDIAEILLKVVLNTKNQIKSNHIKAHLVDNCRFIVSVGVFYFYVLFIVTAI
jgi:hypothetical protein